MRAHTGLLQLVVVAIAACATAVIAPSWAVGRPLPEAPACSFFPPDNPWNQRVGALPVAANSATMLAYMQINRLHADFSDSDAWGYGIPYNVVDAATPRRQVTFEYADESDPGPYPIPEQPLQEGGSDRHILMVDRDSCVLSELFAADRGATGEWTAGSGAVFDLTSNALRPETWTSADAAGLPIMPGLARHDEVAHPLGIDHGLRITIPVSQRAYLWPARHYASSDTRPWTGPMGLRLRVRAGYDISGYPPQARAILAAGKRYGFIVADNGSAGFISGAPAPGWDDDDLHALHQVPRSALEVVDTSTLPGTPTVRRAINTRFDYPGAYVRVSLLHSRAGYLTLRAVRNGRVVASRRVWARQGFVRFQMARVTGASYRLALA